MVDIRAELFFFIRHITNQQEFLKKAKEIEGRLFDEIFSDPNAVLRGWQRSVEGLKGQPEVQRRMELKYADIALPKMIDIFLHSDSRHDAWRAHLTIGGKDGPSRSARKDPRVLELAANVLGLAR
ncbi:MAG: hypothetical protein A3H71_00980 [Candidatus Sungbacteria bacterium RIFCSPLOWO2_02_FULL_48_13b]|uniref:Uncharacterized protein n=2 Tax=Candidatus Sungiibacteriota TaxID=1817917 RepID=A0A1G2LJB9_9BACT|nr:MAG: hypothetical protein A3C12_01965 [Candidatus Sungbacteria bacterium RIFCSPHIGHO2_02_FULL_49_20]OHA11725.1 MAG: hypothetical protein A3H71_00980 [Candidatus Sungbacteria bacterium RIFCSPLOWO2_02_FULL_48_13b]